MTERPVRHRLLHGITGLPRAAECRSSISTSHSVPAPTNLSGPRVAVKRVVRARAGNHEPIVVMPFRPLGIDQVEHCRRRRRCCGS